MTLHEAHTVLPQAYHHLQNEELHEALSLIESLPSINVDDIVTNDQCNYAIDYHTIKSSVLRKQKKTKELIAEMSIVHAILQQYPECSNAVYNNQRLSNEGFIAFDSGEYKQCIELLRGSISACDEGDKHTIAENYVGIGQSYALLSEYDLSKEAYHRAIALYTEVHNKSGLANAYHYLGVAYSNMLNYVEALDCLQQSMGLFKEIHNVKGTLSCLGNIGVVYVTVGDVPKAIDYFQQTLALSESVGDMNAAGISIINISNLFYESEHYDEAFEYRKKALEVFKDSSNKLVLAACYVNMGTSHLQTKEYEQALDCFKTGHTLYQEINVKSGICSALISIADTYIQMKDYDNARIQLQEAIDLAEVIDDKDELSNAFIKLSEILSESTSKHYSLQKAEEYIQKAITISEHHELRVRHYNAIHQLAMICELQERWKEANTNNKLYFHLKEEIQSKEADDKMKALDYRRKMEESERARAIEMARLQEKEMLLHDILPSFIAERIVSGEKTIAETKEHVCVLFCDIVGFTRISNEVAPEKIVEVLNDFYSSLDNLAMQYGIEKIKTIGDAYMAACGLTNSFTNTRERAIDFSVEILKISKKYTFPHDIPLQLRIGIHIGTIVAGVIGTQKFSYDVWGDTVNVAARMESSGEPGKIHVTDDMIQNLILDTQSYRIESRGEVSLKGKGIVSTHFIIPH